jgi:hypothetical protein
MGAMLDAMKKLNTGSAAVSAMQRLETAYVKVEKTLSENALAEAKTSSEPAVAPTTPTTPTTPTVAPVFQPKPSAEPTPQPARQEGLLR